MSEVIFLGTGTDGRLFLGWPGFQVYWTPWDSRLAYFRIHPEHPPNFRYPLGEPWFKSGRFYSITVSPVFRGWGGGGCSSPNHSKQTPKEPQSSCFNRIICSFLATQMGNGSQILLKFFPIILLPSGFRCLTWSIMSTCPRTVFWWVELPNLEL